MALAYRIGELAARTGVSIRTLRHYDQIGLLAPSDRSASGYRLYGERDLLRLQRILTLRYLDFSLREIGELLAEPEPRQVELLRAQRRILRERISALERVERSVGRLLERRLVTGEWDWELAISASANIQSELEKGERQMTPDERKKKFEELGKMVTQEEIAAVERGWEQLLVDVRAGFGLDPASAAAQALGDRWNALLQATFRGHTDLMAGVAEGYKKGEYAQTEGAPTAEDFAFIAKVFAVRKAQG